jgi:hypothetical protein
MRIHTIIFIILISSLWTFGQTELNTCTQSDSPIIEGLQLNTPLSIVKRDTKLNFDKAEKTLRSGFEVFEFDKLNKSVDYLYLSFYKDNLAAIGVGYSNELIWNSMELKWTTIEEFRNKISETLNVWGMWDIRSKTYLQLDCKNFILSIYGGNSFMLGAGSKAARSRYLKEEEEEEKQKERIQQKKKEILKP